jgi:hypothetical protein
MSKIRRKNGWQQLNHGFIRGFPLLGQCTSGEARESAGGAYAQEPRAQAETLSFDSQLADAGQSGYPYQVGV